MQTVKACWKALNINMGLLGIVGSCLFFTGGEVRGHVGYVGSSLGGDLLAGFGCHSKMGVLLGWPKSIGSGGENQ